MHRQQRTMKKIDFCESSSLEVIKPFKLELAPVLYLNCIGKQYRVSTIIVCTLYYYFPRYFVPSVDVQILILALYARTLLLVGLLLLLLHVNLIPHNYVV